MLKLYALVRLALSRSPTREQHEIKFATNNNDPSTTPLPPGEGAPPKAPSGIEGSEVEGRVRDEEESTSPSPIAETTQETSTEVQSVLSTLDAQQIFAEIEGMDERELFEQLLEQEETLAGTDLAAAARKAGIAVTFGKTMAPQKFFPALYAYERDRGIAPDAKKKFIHALLEQSPQVAAALSRGLLGRIRDFEGQHRIIETCRKELGSEGIQQAIHIARQEQSVEEALMTLEQRRPSMHAQLPKARPILINAAKAIRNTEIYGARYWGVDGASPDQDDARRKSYLQSLRVESQKIAQLFNPQIQRGIEEIAAKLETNAVIIRARYPRLPEDALRRGEGEFIERLKRVAGVLEGEGALPPKDLDAPDFPRKLEDYIRARSKAATQLQAIRRDAEVFMEKRTKNGPIEELRDLREQDAWAERCLPMVRALLTDPDALEPQTREHLQGLQERLQDREALAAYDEQGMAREEYALRMLILHGEDHSRRMNAEGAAMLSSVGEELKTSGQEAWAHNALTELEETHGALAALLTHPVCAELKVAKQLAEEATTLRGQLSLLEDDKIAEESMVTEVVANVGVHLKQWKTALERVRSLDEATRGQIAASGNDFVRFLPDAEYQKMFKEEETLQKKYSRACYRKGKIWIRGSAEQLGAQRVTQLVEHEKSHALLDILTNQSRLLPFLFEDAFGDLSEEQWQLLEENRARWGVPSREEVMEEYRKLNPKTPEELLRARADARYRRMLLNEAAVSGSLAEADPADRSLLERLGSGESEDQVKHPEFALHEMDEPAPVVNEAEMAQSEATTDSYDPHEDLEATERMITSIRTFGEAVGDSKQSRHNYLPHIAAQIAQVVGTGRDSGLHDVLDQLQTIQRSGKTRDTGERVDPAHNKKYRETVAEFKSHVDKIHKQVKEIDHQISEVTKAPTAKKRSMKELLGIHTLCILDIMRIWKEFREDIEGMWHSMQDQKTSEAKAAWFARLPVNIPGTNIKIPIIGKYTERLPHYAERKKNQLELERVGKWKDSFKNLDAESLLELIGATPTRDQLRASIELLVEKGRMNWADPRVWKGLNEKSKYKMPEGPCRRSEVLRDKWLHKLIADIWTDKDMFNEWVTGNNSHFDSHKKAYTHEADNFSNIAGGLAHELKSILHLYVEHKKSGKEEPMPEEVNPHHYEELLHYAMRMGKMSMEQKVFYLIHGLASGLMPLERLRALAGESGELLLKFPFLDYFYTRHNSLQEIKALAGRLTEDGDPFEPGMKTTMFMRLVLLRDLKARERMSKALDRRAEEIDHEDLPYLATDIDWSRMNNLMDVISGGRSKITREGAKNTYVGFNEKFKVYAHLARFADETEAPVFRDNDTQDLAQSLAAYVVFDNQMRSAVKMREGRLSLARQNIDNESPVSNPALRTSAFRNRTRDFVWELAQAVGMQDSDLNVAGITLHDFLASAEHDPDTTPVDIRGKVDQATSFFANAFIKKIAAHPGELKRLLKKFETGAFAAGQSFLDSTTSATGSTELNYNNFKARYASITGGEPSRKTSASHAHAH